MIVHDGDLAQYAGTHKALVGRLCEVGTRTPTGKRVRCLFRLPGGVVVRLIKPENLKKLGGG